MIHTPEFVFVGGDARTGFAVHRLTQLGYAVSDRISAGTTHVVLPMPAFDGSSVRGGPPVEKLLTELRAGITVVGGYLDIQLPAGVNSVELSRQEDLCYANADITAEAAVYHLMDRLPCCLRGCPILITGYGRIGRLLANKLTALGADVTVCARNPGALAQARLAGCSVLSLPLTEPPAEFRAVCNTVPARILPESLPPEAVLIELASWPGGFTGAAADRVLRLGGLPGKYAPESAGIALGECLARIAEEDRYET